MLPGDVIAERFEIERHAVAGGMGEVYQARDQRTGGALALKVLRAGASIEADRFAREAEVLATLNHPGIVRYLGHGQTAGGEMYLAMEWLTGETLAARLRRAKLSIAETTALGIRVAEALGEAHLRGVVHRDLKPSNLFLRGGSIEAPTLIDFGIARVQNHGITLTMPGAMLGTPGYVAPEQAVGARDIDRRADVFSLGCVLFNCLTGRAVFEGKDAFAVLLKVVLEEPPPLRELRPEIPSALEQLVARMLSKAPADRPADVAAVAAELSLLAELPASSREASVAVASPEITIVERRVMSLVVVRFGEGNVEQTLKDAESRARERTLHAAVERQKGRIELLADGSLLVVLTSAGAAPATDLAARAARCALSMQSLLDEATFAVVSGRAVLASRLPTGELIDRVVALLGCRRQGIRLDEVTVGLLDARFEIGTDAAGAFLTGERTGLAATRTLLGKPMPCVGRERELALLLSIVAERIEDRTASAVLVTAAAGVGKSRLGQELLRRLRERSEAMEIWIGRGDPLTAGSAFGLLAQAIRGAAGIVEGEPPPVRRQRLRARVARNLGGDPRAHSRISAFLGELVGTSFPEDDDVQLRAARRDPVLMGDQMRRAFEAFVAAECAAQPVLLVLEDLHWGDLPTVKFVDAALRNLQELPLCVLSLARPEVHAVFPNLWAERPVQMIRLGELGRRASEQLVRLALGDEVSAETVRATVERASGNAFYLEELIRAVAEGQDGALPETVLAMVQARLEGFDTEARRVLRAASIFGQTFWEGGVSALLGGAEARRWLGYLVEREVISARAEEADAPLGKTEYSFRHAVVREAAYGMLTERDRTVGHRLAGAWLAQVGEGDAMALAEHFERGAEPARAATWYRRAAEQAFEGNDFEATIARAERGARCLPRAEAPDREVLGQLRVLQAGAHQWRGENAEAERCGLEAMDLLPLGSAPWCRAAGEVTRASSRLGDDRFIAVSEALLRIATEGEPSIALALALVRAAASVRFFTRRHDLADVLLHTTEALSRRLGGDPAISGRVYADRATSAIMAGDVGEYLRLSEAAWRHVEQAGDAREACHQAMNVGYAQLQLGDDAEAERVFRKILSDAKAMGLASVVPHAQHNLGLILAQQGKFDEARAIEEEALSTFRSHGHRRGEAGARIYLARIAALAGDLDRSAEEARGVAFEPTVVPPVHAYALALLADARLAQGRAAEGLAAAREAIAILGSLEGIDEGEALIRVMYAATLDATGDPVAARTALTEALDHLLKRADKIADPARRRSFLERVPDNARTLELARRWLGQGEGGEGDEEGGRERQEA
jgi:tetratricopeptide (TPR) repeat protein